MKLRTLVFSGCGTRIIGHTGFLKCIEQKFDLSEVNTYAGTSAGSFIALCMVLGYTPNEIYELLIGLDYLKVSNIDTDLLIDYYSNFGVDNGNKVVKLIKLLIEKKVGNPEITFRELHSITGKTLVTATTNITRECVEYVSHETYPDLPVYLGIKMSGSIPFYFTPVEWQGCLYVDGALIDNFPIKNFDLNETLGMYIKQLNPPPEKIPDLLTYTVSILGTILKTNENNLISKYSDNLVLIENKESMLDFKLSKEKRQLIYEMAFNATQDFLDKLSEKERLRKQEEIELENEHVDEKRDTQEEELNIEPRGTDGEPSGESSNSETNDRDSDSDREP